MQCSPASPSLASNLTECGIAPSSPGCSDNMATKVTKPDGRWGDDIFIAAPGGGEGWGCLAQGGTGGHTGACARRALLTAGNRPISVPCHIAHRRAAGSSIALNKLPPESVARIFPRRANTLLYTAPPPAPMPPPMPSSPYMVGWGCIAAACAAIGPIPHCIQAQPVPLQLLTWPHALLSCSARRSRRRSRSLPHVCAPHRQGE